MRLLLVLAALSTASALQAQPLPAWLRADATPLTSTWVGIYDCSQGETALALDLTGDADGGVKGSFRFGPTDGNPDVPEGSYRVTGAHYVDGRFSLLGERWENRPPDYVMVDVEGAIGRSDRLLIVTICGNVTVLQRD